MAIPVLINTLNRIDKKLFIAKVYQYARRPTKVDSLCVGASIEIGSLYTVIRYKLSGEIVA
jgi:hypothetical protein